MKPDLVVAIVIISACAFAIAIGFILSPRRPLHPDEDASAWHMYRRWWREEQAKTERLQSENDRLVEQIEQLRKGGPYR